MQRRTVPTDLESPMRSMTRLQADCELVAMATWALKDGPLRVLESPDHNQTAPR